MKYFLTLSAGLFFTFSVLAQTEQIKLNLSIDMNDKHASEWINPDPEDSDLANMLLDAVSSGKVQAYDPMGEPFDPKAAETRVFSTDTILITDPITLDEKYEIVQSMVNMEYVTIRFETETEVAKDFSSAAVNVKKIWFSWKQHDRDGKFIGTTSWFYVEVK